MVLARLWKFPHDISPWVELSDTRPALWARLQASDILGQSTLVGVRSTTQSFCPPLSLCMLLSVFLPNYLGDSPSDRRDVHVEDLTSVFFCPIGNNRVHPGGPIPCFSLSFAPPSYCAACLHFDREKGSAIRVVPLWIVHPHLRCTAV